MWASTNTRSDQPCTYSWAPQFVQQHPIIAVCSLHSQTWSIHMRRAESVIQQRVSHTGHSKTVGPHYWTCCMPSFWRLDFAGGSQTFGKAVDHCVTHIFRPVGRRSSGLLLYKKTACIISVRITCFTNVAYVLLSALMTTYYLAETRSLNICVHPTIRLRMAKYFHSIQFVKMDAVLPRLNARHRGISRWQLDIL